jgi:predicted DNA repair protein MutK
MAGGLAALLDDVAALARMTAASVDDVAAAAGRASAKAAGVVVDDAAVTPRYVQGLDAKRELGVIWRIAKGSIRNKLLFILPAVLLLSEFLPALLTPLLLVGGTYLCFEGAEKIYEKLSGHEKKAKPSTAEGPEAEDTVVAGAVRTDFILSAEIMVIALNEVASETFWSRAVILFVVAIGITVLVYGAVALIIRMDDLGLRLAGTANPRVQSFGTGLVKAMPIVLSVLGTVGIAAMLWVGGHIWLVGLDDLGFTLLYDAVHVAEDAVAGLVPALDGLLAWTTNTLFSALLGAVIGAVVVAVMHVIPRRSKAH